MPRYRHPSAGDGPGVPPARVHVSRGEVAPVDESGVFEAPQRVAQAIADHHDTTVGAMRVDGEGGDEGGACPYCDDYDGEYVAQHVAQAHPEVSDDE
jgi:hypothetical protein